MAILIKEQKKYSRSRVSMTLDVEPPNKNKLKPGSKSKVI